MGKDSARLAVLSGTLCFLGALILVAVLFGSDTAQLRLVQYLSSAAPVILGFAFMQSRQKDADEKSADTREKVTYLAGSLNGKLDKRFADLESKLTDRIAESKVTVAPTSTGEIAVITNGKDKNNDDAR